MILKDKINRSIIIDITILLFTGIVFITYQYEKNLSPGFFLLFVQMMLLWFALRIVYRFFPGCKMLVLTGLLLWGVVEAIWGFGQLYNYFPSEHVMYKTTGSFFNPGPYGGFIALMFPLALHFWFFYRYKNKLIGHLFLLAGIACLLVFPATLSRTAWIASVIGCGLVLFMDTQIGRKLKKFRTQHRKIFVRYTIFLCMLTVVTGYGTYHLKKDSADGRLFMWKITMLAMTESPVKGVGLGGFPAAYAKDQMDYFKREKASETEKKIAGSPEYAFNEYLRIFLEQGIFGGILFLLLTFLIIRNGIKSKHTAAAGSFLTLSVFAFASYPYYLWEFLVTWVLLGTICVSETNGFSQSKVNMSGKKVRIIISAIMFLAVLTADSFIVKLQIPFYQAKKEWKRLRPFYTMKVYASMVDEYKLLYPKLNYDPKFVFEYAVALNAMEQHEEADSVLSRGLQLSCDPMFYNVKGRNYHEMGEYDKAESCYINSTWLLPERIYPYFLLTKLYADTVNYQPEKMRHAASAVLEKEPKVYSTAIMEMRDEVRKILKEKEMTNEQ